ncbi:hypothetical protein QJQ45_026091, partial [Haematococcus lacustris]
GRVLIAGERATVHYVGTVAGQDGEWVGVEWDDQQRGKHDGCTGGVRYFQTNAPTAASFVKIGKVQAGYGVAEALEARYSNQRGELGEVEEREMYVHTVRRRRVQIHVVGVDRIQQQQSQLGELVSARLVGAAVSHVVRAGAMLSPCLAAAPSAAPCSSPCSMLLQGDAKRLASACPRLTELDLTGNLIGDWTSFVPALMQACTSLQTLNLSDNRLGFGSVPGSIHSLPRLRVLVLNDCHASWHDVLALEPQLPALQELHLSGNGLHDLAGQAPAPASPAAAGGEQLEGTCLALVTGFTALQVLSLEDNALKDWQEVARLQQLPSLTTLILSHNPLTSVSYPGGVQAGTGHSARPPFAALQRLIMAGCALASWADVDALDRFPALHEARLTGNACLAASKSGGRFEIIGRVGGLTSLNGADIKPRERRDAELRYLQAVMTELAEASDADTHAAITANHPRAKLLAAKFGEELTNTSQGHSGHSIASSLVQLTLTCVAAAAGAKMGSSTKKLPRGTALAALKLVCEKLFKVRVAQQRLFVKAPGDPVPEEVAADDDSRTLAHLGVQDGWEVLVDEVDPQVQALAMAAARDQGQVAHEERLGQQLKAASVLQAEFARTMGLTTHPEAREAVFTRCRIAETASIKETVGPGPLQAELCRWHGRPAMPMPGRPGQEWVYLPDKALLRKWRRKWRESRIQQGRDKRTAKSKLLCLLGCAHLRAGTSNDLGHQTLRDSLATSMQPELSAPVPWDFTCSGQNAAPVDKPVDPRIQRSQLAPHEQQQQGPMAPFHNDALLTPLPPSADWVKLQQRLSELRTGLEKEKAVSSCLQQQVDGLTESLRCKHEENTYLQLQLQNAERGVQLLHGSLHGNSSMVQSAVLAEVQGELQETTQHCLELEAGLQRLQFELQACRASSEAGHEAEHAELTRCTTELGQARLLAAARLRQIDNVQGQVAEQQVALATARSQMAELADDAHRAAQVSSEQVLELQAQLQAAQQECEQLRSTLAAEQATGQDMRKANAELCQHNSELRMQTEWLEAAVTDLQAGNSAAGTLSQLHAELRRLHELVSSTQAAAQKQQMELTAELQASKSQVTDLLAQLQKLQATDPCPQDQQQGQEPNQERQQESVSADQQQHTDLAEGCGPSAAAAPAALTSTAQGHTNSSHLHWANRVAELVSSQQAVEAQLAQESARCAGLEQQLWATLQELHQLQQHLQQQQQLQHQSLQHQRSQQEREVGLPQPFHPWPAQGEHQAGPVAQQQPPRQPANGALWAEALGLDDGDEEGTGPGSMQPSHSEPMAGGGDCNPPAIPHPGQVHALPSPPAAAAPTVVKTDAAVQTAEVPADRQLSSEHLAVLQAAHAEVLRLKNTNKRLMEDSAAAKRDLVPVADVRRLLAEARTASRTKLDEALAAAATDSAARVNKLQQELAVALQQLTAVQQDLAVALQQLTAVQQDLAAAQEEVKAAQQQLSSRTDELAAAEQHTSAVRQEADAAQQLAARQCQELSVAQEQLSVAQQELGALRQELSAVQQQLAESKKAVEEARSEGARRASLVQAQQVAATAERVSHLQAEVAAAHALHQGSQQQVMDLQSQMQAMQQEMQQVRSSAALDRDAAVSASSQAASTALATALSVAQQQADAALAATQQQHNQQVAMLQASLDQLTAELQEAKLQATTTAAPGDASTAAAAATAAAAIALAEAVTCCSCGCQTDSPTHNSQAVQASCCQTSQGVMTEQVTSRCRAAQTCSPPACHAGCQTDAVPAAGPVSPPGHLHQQREEPEAGTVLLPPSHLAAGPHDAGQPSAVLPAPLSVARGGSHLLQRATAVELLPPDGLHSGTEVATASQLLRGIKARLRQSSVAEQAPNQEQRLVSTSGVLPAPSSGLLPYDMHRHALSHAHRRLSGPSDLPAMALPYNSATLPTHTAQLPHNQHHHSHSTTLYPAALHNSASEPASHPCSLPSACLSPTRTHRVGHRATQEGMSATSPPSHPSPTPPAKPTEGGRLRPSEQPGTALSGDGARPAARLEEDSVLLASGGHPTFSGSAALGGRDSWEGPALPLRSHTSLLLLQPQAQPGSHNIPQRHEPRGGWTTAAAGTLAQAVQGGAHVEQNHAVQGQVRGSWRSLSASPPSVPSSPPQPLPSAAGPRPPAPHPGPHVLVPQVSDSPALLRRPRHQQDPSPSASPNDSPRASGPMLRAAPVHDPLSLPVPPAPSHATSALHTWGCSHNAAGARDAAPVPHALAAAGRQPWQPYQQPDGQLGGARQGPRQPAHQPDPQRSSSGLFASVLLDQVLLDLSESRAQRDKALRQEAAAASQARAGLPPPQPAWAPQAAGLAHPPRRKTHSAAGPGSHAGQQQQQQGGWLEAGRSGLGGRVSERILRPMNLPAASPGPVGVPGRQAGVMGAISPAARSPLTPSLPSRKSGKSSAGYAAGVGAAGALLHPGPGHCVSLLDLASAHKSSSGSTANRRYVRDQPAPSMESSDSDTAAEAAGTAQQGANCAPAQLGRDNVLSGHESITQSSHQGIECPIALTHGLRSNGDVIATNMHRAKHPPTLSYEALHGERPFPSRVPLHAADLGVCVAGCASRVSLVCQPGLWLMGTATCAYGLNGSPHHGTKGVAMGGIRVLCS